MIKSILIAGLIPMLAPYEWTHWKMDFSGYTHACWVHPDSGLLGDCFVVPDNYRNFPVWKSRIFEENSVNGYFVCGDPVSKSEFDSRITRWRDHGFPRGICEGKPIS